MLTSDRHLEHRSTITSHQCLDGSQQPAIYFKHSPHPTLNVSAPNFSICLQFLTALTNTQPVMSSFLNVNLTGCNSPWFPEEMTTNFMPWPLEPHLSKTSAGLKLKNLRKFLLKDRTATNGNLKGFMIPIFTQTWFQNLKSQVWLVELIEYLRLSRHVTYTTWYSDYKFGSSVNKAHAKWIKPWLTDRSQSSWQHKVIGEWNCFSLLLH